MFRYLPLLTPLLSAETFLVSDQILSRETRDFHSGDGKSTCSADLPCLNGGTCTDLPDNTFSCSCTSNFYGTTCENTYADCTDTRCGTEGGFCTEVDRTETGVAAYTCDCDAGYENESSSDMSPCVDIDECASVTCVHPAICNNLVNEFKCGDSVNYACDYGWTGTFCDEAVDPCTTDLNTLADLGTDFGECVEDQAISCTPGDGAGSFTCECEEAYKGQTCAESKKLISEVTVDIQLGGITSAGFASMDQDTVKSALENDVETFYSNNEDFLGVSGTTLTHSEDDSRVDISYQTSLAQDAVPDSRRRRSTGRFCKSVAKMAEHPPKSAGNDLK